MTNLYAPNFYLGTHADPTTHDIVIITGGSESVTSLTVDTVLTSAYTNIECDTKDNTIQLTLPLAANTAGHHYYICLDNHINDMTLTRSVADTIGSGGDTSIIFDESGQRIHVYSNGDTIWRTI